MDDFGGGMQAEKNYYESNALGQVRQKQMTYSERVSQSVIDAEERLKDLKRMQEIFAQHPEFEELLTLVQRGRV
jgi:hypothetical protein